MTKAADFPGTEDQLIALAEDSPAMLWRGDVNGRCVYLNAPMRAFWGLEPEECLTFQWSSSLLPEDQEAVFGPFSAGMANQQPFTCEGRYRRADGEIRILRTRAKPCFDEKGAFAGQIGVNEDITELRNAEAGLRDAVRQHAAVADRLKLATAISGLAMSEHDGELRYTWAHNVNGNPLGKTPSELVGAQIGAQLEAILRRTIQDGEPQSREMALTVDGMPLWIDLQTAPTTDHNGQPGVVASALDVTTRKLNEQKLAVLARELGHRVKNVFALVQAVIRQSALSTDVSPDFVSVVAERINALARAQDALVSMADDRVSLRSLLHAHVSHLAGVEMSGEEMSVPGRVAPYLALAVHELGTNAAKHGGLSIEGGSTRLEWNMGNDGTLHLHWQECGGPEVQPPARSGFGTKLLTTIFSNATGGTVELCYPATGLNWKASLPLAPQVGTSEPPLPETAG